MNSQSETLHCLRIECARKPEWSPKESLEGNDSKAMKKLEAHVHIWLKTRPSAFYDHGIFKIQCQKCVDNTRDYTKKC